MFQQRRWRLIHAVCRFLQSCSNIRKMTCFWWQWIHYITIHTLRLSLSENCLKINVKDVPTLAVCHLATHPKSTSCGSWRICLLIFHMFFLETSQYPSGFCLKEETLFVRLIVFRFDLPQAKEIKNPLCQPKLYSLSSSQEIALTCGWSLRAGCCSLMKR